jgi:hypothetical protein
MASSLLRKASFRKTAPAFRSPKAESPAPSRSAIEHGGEEADQSPVLSPPFSRAPDRGWTQLVESVNEVRGYQHARAIGYENCRLLDEQSHPFPDVEASNSAGKWCLLEVKTIQESAEELRLRGEVQAAEPGLPMRLTRVLRRRYLHACQQIAGHARASEAERICFMIINLDLRTVLAQENKRLLEDFLRTIEEDVKIQSISQHWPAGV